MDAGKSLREHGLRIGELEPGPAASIADVSDVTIGHATGAPHRYGMSSAAPESMPPLSSRSSATSGADSATAPDSSDVSVFRSEEHTSELKSP